MSQTVSTKNLTFPSFTKVGNTVSDFIRIIISLSVYWHKILTQRSLGIYTRNDYIPNIWNVNSIYIVQRSAEVNISKRECYFTYSKWLWFLSAFPLLRHILHLLTLRSDNLSLFPSADSLLFLISRKLCGELKSTKSSAALADNYHFIVVM